MRIFRKINFSMNCINTGLFYFYFLTFVNTFLFYNTEIIALLNRFKYILIINILVPQERIKYR